MRYSVSVRGGVFTGDVCANNAVQNNVMPDTNIRRTANLIRLFFISISPVIQRLNQPGDLRVLRGVIHGFSEEARTRGFPSPPFGGFGFVGVASDLRIVVRWHIASRPPMSASGR